VSIRVIFIEVRSLYNSRGDSAAVAAHDNDNKWGRFQLAGLLRWGHRPLKRIFLALTVVSTVLLVAALVLGFEIGDPRSVAPATRKLLSYHVLISMAALIFAALVHAVHLIYFMGTSRWMEEARQAYKFDSRWSEENRRLKYRTIPVMAICTLLLILNVPLGALSVDRADWTVPGVGAVSPSRVHLLFAIFTIGVNLAVNAVEYRAISRNSQLITEVVGEVRRIREARGLPVS
jgi:hypothetical protein